MKNNNKASKEKILKRLWKDFPELWRMVDCWKIQSGMPIPRVQNVTKEVLDQVVEKGYEWWIATETNYFIEMFKFPDPEGYILRREIARHSDTTAFVRLLVCRKIGAEPQDFVVYKAVKDWSIRLYAHWGC